MTTNEYWWINKKQMWGKEKFQISYATSVELHSWKLQDPNWNHNEIMALIKAKKDKHIVAFENRSMRPIWDNNNYKV